MEPLRRICCILCVLLLVYFLHSFLPHSYSLSIYLIFSLFASVSFALSTHLFLSIYIFPLFSISLYVSFSLTSRLAFLGLSLRFNFFYYKNKVWVNPYNLFFAPWGTPSINSGLGYIIQYYSVPKQISSVNLILKKISFHWQLCFEYLIILHQYICMYTYYLKINTTHF